MEEDINSFVFNIKLNELSTNGVVKFCSKKCDDNSFWNDKKLTIPISGVYKIDWGFCKNSISAFYQNSKTELALVINNRLHAEKALITKGVSDVDVLKSSHKTITLILSKNETLSLYAEIFNAKCLNMKDVYLKVLKLEMKDDN